MAKPHVESHVNSGDMDDYSRRELATRRQPVRGREAVPRPVVTSRARGYALLAPNGV